MRKGFDWFSSKAASAVRSPWFFILFNVWTLAWILGLGPLLKDKYPFVFWVTIVTYMTQADMILYGVWQKQLQAKQDEQSLFIQQALKNQQDMMLFLVAEAKEHGEQLDDILEETEKDIEKSTEILSVVDTPLEMEEG